MRLQDSKPCAFIVCAGRAVNVIFMVRMSDPASLMLRLYLLGRYCLHQTNCCPNSREHREQLLMKVCTVCAEVQQKLH